VSLCAFSCAASLGFINSGKTIYLSSVYSLHSSHYGQGRYLQALDMITLALEQADEGSPFITTLVQGNAAWLAEVSAGKGEFGDC
jgi:hypothetical protein